MARLRRVRAAVLSLILISGGGLVARAQDDGAPPTTEAPPASTIVPGGPPTTAPEGDGPTTTTVAEDPNATTTTTVAGDETGPTTTTVPGDGRPSDGGDGDGGAPAGAPRVIPPEAQRLIRSVRRTAPNSTAKLIAALQPLTAYGMTEQQALLLGMGRFPVAGPARYSDDWWNPRYTPHFHLHLGTDIFAPFGTPVRAPVDGTAKITNGPTGGLAVYVTMPDRTYFYLAHLSAVTEGLRNGQKVTTGQVVGFVGDSGNARGGSPHLHLEIHPRGGGPTPPKPYLDKFLAEALGQAPTLIDRFRSAYEQRQAATAPAAPPVTKAAAPAPPPPLPSPVLWASSMTPAGAPFQVAEVEVAAAAASIDWVRLERRERATTALWEQAELAADAMIRPIIAPSLVGLLG